MDRNPKTLGVFFSLLIATSVVLVFYLEYGSEKPRIEDSATFDSAALDSVTLDSAELESNKDYLLLEKNVTARSTDHLEMKNDEEVLIDYPNFPWSSYSTERKTPKNIKEHCGYYPSLDNIEFSNLYWQKSTLNKVEFHLYGAYYDNRTKNINKPTVRILAMVNKVTLDKTKTYCQMWFKNRGVVSDTTFHYYIWHRNWGGQTDKIYQPYLINCRIPAEFKDKVPTSVSLVAEKCQNATNNLKVHYNNPEDKTDFAVCVKGLDFHSDMSVKLVEWIESIKVLGGSKIYIYDLFAHKNIQRILQFYKNTSLVDVTLTSLPGRYPNIHEVQHKFLKDYIVHKRLTEVIPYNDCFYRHMYEHKYIILLDIDEIIMPAEGDWFDLFTTLQKSLKDDQKSSYSVQNVYFLDEFLKEPFEDIPSYMHMVQHVFRTKDFTGKGKYVKSFHNTDAVLTLHNHYPINCLSGCSAYDIPTNIAQLQHYRDDCVGELKKECKLMKRNIVKDTKIWRFKELLIESVNRTLSELELLPMLEN